ncbi:hypothetical protein, partial [Burkholderia cenocepacia]|uniref:hypothetical protein n=1 Tax=Burkholderia cenocepacia TaxID=95486 RepID=UPI00265107AC|nr:hypothetical protein [Burkholderia cenocepacia]
MEDWVVVAGFGGREAVDVALAPLRRTLFWRTNAKTPALSGGGFWLEGSLTITYFHTGIRTIIGVESFHGPVR